MATLTYDPSAPKDGEFTPEEQESIKVGEQLENEQKALLAGKYENAEQLEKAYMELQSKLGSNSEDSEETEETEESSEDTEIDTAFLDTLWEESQGEYSKETLEKLSQMKPEDLAQMHLQYRMNASEETQSDFTDEQVTALKGIVGGDENYTEMLSWASSNVTKEEVDLFDRVMDSGNPEAAFFAIRAMSQQWADSKGYEGELLKGKPAKTKQDVFRSQAEVVRAMEDPRYNRDPAYRQDVFDKLERSQDLQF